MNADPPRPTPICASTTREIARAVRLVLRRERVHDSELEDLEQLTWLRLLERLHDRPEVASLPAYAAGVAYNVVREHRVTRARRRQLERVFGADLAELGRGSEAPPADTCCQRRELEQLLHHALSRLSPRERFLLDARFIEDVSYAALLPRFLVRFGRAPRTEVGLRAAVFQVRHRVSAWVEAADRVAIRDADDTARPPAWPGRDRRSSLDCSRRPLDRKLA